MSYLNEQQQNLETEYESRNIHIWNHLTLAQKFTGYFLGKFGYQLTDLAEDGAVIYIINNRRASIDYEGETTYSFDAS